MTAHMLRTKNFLAQALTFNMIRDPRFFVGMRSYGQVTRLVRLLVAQGHDVWFVTMPIFAYNKDSSLQQKQAQIRRLFGHEMGRKIILTADKDRVPGRFMIDDSREVYASRESAPWRLVIVDQPWNRDLGNCGRLHPATAVEDFRRISGLPLGEAQSE